METCVRGFSFMPQETVSLESLQYIEGEELTRKWRASRRERTKQREQRIWEEFVEKENDVLTTLCKDDPYQFLEQLPEECLKEIMDTKLKQMQNEADDDDKDVDGVEVGRGDSVLHLVTFAEDIDKEDTEMFTIFDDKEDEKSAPEDEGTDSLSPSTVREQSPDSRAVSPDKASSKSSENVANVIENSIYFAKVKDLRNKISEELSNIVLALERRDVMNIDPEDLVKMCRRSAEFSARFNRVHMYQLNRQISDLERNNSLCLPFAKHTQFQAQMIRIASLHQNMYQAFQIFHRSIEQTACVREGIDTLRSLVALCRQAGAAAHRPLAAAGSLSADRVNPSCDFLEEAINEYAARLASYMDSNDNTHTSHSRRSAKGRSKKSTIGSWSHKSVKPGKSLSDPALSRSGGTSKERGARAPPEPRRARRREPRSRRPLMRDPNCGKTKSKRKITRESEIRTMVETVGTITCTSSRVSCEMSPLPPLKLARRRSKDATPRSQRAAPRRAPLTPRKQPPTPQKKPPSTPKFKRQPLSPPIKEGGLKAAISTISNEILEASAAIRPILMNDKKIDKKAPMSKQSEMTDTSRPIYISEGSQSPSPRSVNDSPRLGESPRPVGSPRTTGETPRSMVDTPRAESSRALADYTRAMMDASRATAAAEIGKNLVRRGEGMTSEKRCEMARERSKATTLSSRCEVSRIVRQLCGGDTTAGSRNERMTGAKNAQLLCLSGSSSPRQPSTPQLLRILEETIQKKVPKHLFQNPTSKDREHFRMTFNIPEVTADKLFQYRTKFVQHMLASPMYANSQVGKPWEVISRISDQIIDELVGTCAKEIQMESVIQRLYNLETR